MGTEKNCHEEKMGKYTLGKYTEVNWNEEHKGIHLAKTKKIKTDFTLSMVWQRD